MIEAMTEPDYQETIALSEDPGVTGDDVRGQPFGPERYAELADFADSMFYKCSLDEQVEVARCLPAHISARRLAHVPDRRRSDILSQLPSDLAEEITSLLPVAVS